MVRGELGPAHGRTFEGMALVSADGETSIIGEVVDQAQLQGLIDRVADLGLDLISVNPEPGARKRTPPSTGTGPWG